MKTVLAKSAAVAAVAVIGLPGGAAAWGDDNNAGRCTGRPFKLVNLSDLDDQANQQREVRTATASDFDLPRS